MTLQEKLIPLRAPPCTNDLAAWIDAWGGARRQFEALIDEHERQHPDFHRQWTMGLLDALDESMHELAHRTAWLTEQLARFEEAR